MIKSKSIYLSLVVFYIFSFFNGWFLIPLMLTHPSSSINWLGGLYLFANGVAYIEFHIFCVEQLIKNNNQEE